MRKRLFFIVEELNSINSASLSAISFTKHLNEEYDVFLYSIQPINNGKVNVNYSINPRVRINSLDIPFDDKNRRKYLKDNKNRIIEILSNTSRKGDVYVLFCDSIVKYISSDCRKILITGFSNVESYDPFDEVIFIAKDEYEEKCATSSELRNKSSLITPFPIYERDENFKFHGNRIMCITRISESNNFEPLFNLAKGLKENGMKFSISLCGNGEHFKEVGDRICDLGLDDVINLKEIKDIDQNLIESDLMFYFSSDDSYPIHLVEAISSSVPIVSFSNNKYSKEILREIGILAHSSEEVLEKVLLILKDKIKLAKLKFKTYEYSKMFLKDVTLKQIIKIIEG